MQYGVHEVFSIVETYIRKKSYQHGGTHLEVGFLAFQFPLMTAEQIYDDRISGEKETVGNATFSFRKTLNDTGVSSEATKNLKTSNPRKPVNQTQNVGAVQKCFFETHVRLH
jgi:hypothetical protein